MLTASETGIPSALCRLHQKTTAVIVNRGFYQFFELIYPQVLSQTQIDLTLFLFLVKMRMGHQQIIHSFSLVSIFQIYFNLFQMLKLFQD